MDDFNGFFKTVRYDLLSLKFIWYQLFLLMQYYQEFFLFFFHIDQIKNISPFFRDE